MRLQIFLYFKILASLPLRQGWMPLKHSAHPILRRLPSSSSVFLSFPSLSLLETSWLLRPGCHGPWAGALCSELSTPQLADEHRGTQSSAGFCIAQSWLWELAYVRSICPQSKFQVLHSALLLQSITFCGTWLQPVQIKTLVPLNTVSEASNITTVSLSNIH